MEQAFYIESIAKFARPGALFDPAGGRVGLSYHIPVLANWESVAAPLELILPLVPTVLHVVSIMVMNGMFRTLAGSLVSFERHLTRTDASHSLAWKRFTFEFFDCFAGLLFLAFVKFDLLGARAELTQLFWCDQIRRLCLESLVPFAIRCAQRAISSSSSSSARSKTTQGTGKDAQDADKYEEFDDYLEMVMQLAYVMLFAGAFPLGACAALVCCVFEIKSDLFKLAHLVQRPPRGGDAGISIGAWDGVLVALCFVATLTKSALFSLCSHQLAVLLPDLFVGDGPDTKEGKGGFVIAICFFLEHLLLLLAVALFTAIPDVPNVVACNWAKKYL